jgi:hypothetical protein
MIPPMHSFTPSAPGIEVALDIAAGMRSPSWSFL